MSTDAGSSGACLHCALPIPPSRRRGEAPGFCCFGCRFAYEVAQPSARGEEGGTPSTLLLRLGLGIFLALNIMVASWLGYSQEVFGDAARAEGAYTALTGLFSYLAFFLCTVVIALLGLNLLADALLNLARGRVETQLLIAVGVFSAYGLSAVNTFRGEGSLYFDTAAMVLVVVTLGSYLEAGARQRAASSASALLTDLPSRVLVERRGELVEAATEELGKGDVVVVRPGETVPADGRLVAGTGHVDEASLTGESRPRPVEPGDPLLAGTVSLDGQLRMEAEQVGEDRVLALVERSLAAARAQKPPIQRLADRVAAVFVPGVVLLALAVFGYRALQGEAAAGMLQGLAVLLISCPCALGLAAPLASWHALRRAAEYGILIDSPATLERAAAVRQVFFDKTGTLTRPELDLERATAAPGVDSREALAWAASLEAASTHPIARALVAHAAEHGIVPEALDEASNVPGLGVEGRLGGQWLRLGSVRWAERLGLDISALADDADDDASKVVLMDDHRPLARFDLKEAPRPEAEAVIAELRRTGIDVAVLSGDRAGATARLAARLGVTATGDLLPGEKVERLVAARGEGRLAMVGDGLNDAPVLAAADVGIALGSASDLAKRSGNVRLVADRLDRVPLLFALARDARRRIRWNLAWAFGFNTVGIALAVAGTLTPIFAAVAMVLSSLMVVRISSRAGA